jgi:hypothetical protein
MKLKYRIQKTVALILLILTLALAITSCKGRPLSQTELASTEVGRIGEYSVLYEELYFLANNYKTGLEDDYKNDAEGLKKAVWDSVKSNITENYAILELCKSEGLIYDEKALRKEVDNAIELDIEASFDGSRKDFFESQRAVGLTDHYVRFITGVNLLYSEYAAKLKESDSFPRTDTELVNYISENFVHTWHIAVFVNDGEDRDEKLAKLREAQDLLNNGTSMYELIGSKYNEDATPDYLSDAYGYYFPRGIMDEKYEEAAFTMAVGDNMIVETMAQNSIGDYVECFYLVERLSTTTQASKDEIRKNLATLSKMVADAMIYDKKEQIQKNLSFEPNDFARSLDITALEPAESGIDYQMIITVVASIISCAIAIVLIILVRRTRMKKFQNSIAKNNKRS